MRDPSTERTIERNRAYDKAHPPRTSEERRKRREDRIALEKRMNIYSPSTYVVQRGYRQLLGVRLTPTELQLARKRGEIVEGDS